MLIFPIGKTPGCQYAVQAMEKMKVPLVDHPTPEVTHLLLDVPSFGPDGMLRSGEDLRYYLERLPPSTTVVGGNLNQPVLDNHKIIDLLRDPDYLSINAAITADCALRIAAKEMKVVFFHCPVLVLGWGRIGKCLGQLLKALGADVTIAARKEADIAMIQALGYQGSNIHRLKPLLPGFRVIFNTVPDMILNSQDTAAIPDCIKIDLASTPGIQGEDVIWARGLPGVYAPESSGNLITGTFLKLVRRDEP